MDDLAYWIALSNVPGLGNYKNKLLLESFKTPQNIFEALPEDLKSLKGIGNTIVNSLKTEKKVLLEKAVEEVEKAFKKGFSIIAFNDRAYPSQLKEIADPPLVLYSKGKFVPEDRFSIAVVGTRSPDSYGKKVAFQITSQLAGFKFTIISGLARGIDTIAHRAAINSGGRTVAVLGCGLDIAYPPENMDLIEEIASCGVVISEFPPGTEPAARNFPGRNRIISGLSRGVLVVQAREKSGTLHTVNSALEQGREVFAIPGPIDKELSRGTNSLIKEGAKLVENVMDIIEELGPVNANNATQGIMEFDYREEPSHNEAELSKEEKTILSIISQKEEIYIDDIIRECNLPAGNVSSMLSILEIKGLIKRKRGYFFTRL